MNTESHKAYFFWPVLGIVTFGLLMALRSTLDSTLGRTLAAAIAGMALGVSLILLSLFQSDKSTRQKDGPTTDPSHLKSEPTKE